MSECQSKCACGDICRRVDEHLQHQCPKCNYEQHWTAENVAAAPATPAATPMAVDRSAATVRLNEALDIRKNFHGMAAGLAFGNLMDFVKWLDKHVSELEHAIAMNSEAPQKLPAAAQPQRESEQPEQALREIEAKCLSQARICNLQNETLTVNNNEKQARYWEGRSNAFQDCVAFVRAALSPQTDSQEPR